MRSGRSGCANRWARTRNFEFRVRVSGRFGAAEGDALLILTKRQGRRGRRHRGGVGGVVRPVPRAGGGGGRGSRPPPWTQGAAGRRMQRHQEGAVRPSAAEAGEGRGPPPRPGGEGRRGGPQALSPGRRTDPGRPPPLVDAKGEVLYVGKAKSLKKRLPAYTKPAALSARLQRMVALTHGLEVVTTASEVEALLLEYNLIKRHQPRSTCCCATTSRSPTSTSAADQQPKRRASAKHPGVRQAQGRVFRPVRLGRRGQRDARGAAARFPLRSCSDGIFDNRTRPCLQYQIKRCSAPCVGPDRRGRVHAAARAGARSSWPGATRGHPGSAQGAMADASAASNSRWPPASATASGAGAHHLAPGHQRQLGRRCRRDRAGAGGRPGVRPGVLLRGGQNYGNRAYFPSHVQGADAGECWRPSSASSTSGKPPRLILLSHAAPHALLAKRLPYAPAARSRSAPPKRGREAPLVDQAAAQCPRGAGAAHGRERPAGQAAGGLADRPSGSTGAERIEVYDNSHIQGTDAIGAMIVAGPEGFMKNRLSQVQHPDQGPHAGRRLRHDARGADPPLRPAAARGSRARQSGHGPTWC